VSTTPVIRARETARTVALAAVVLLGPMRAAPGIAVGAFLANVMAHETVPTALGIAAGNTAEALAGGWRLRRGGFESLSRLWDALGLIVFAAGLRRW
jgi:integral membrane sensor domain MASE1